MTSTGPAPEYRCVVNGVGPHEPSFSWRSFGRSWILILLTLGVCFALFFFLLIYCCNSGSTGNICNVFKHAQKAERELLIPASLICDDYHNVMCKVVRHELLEPDPHNVKEKAELPTKIGEDLESDRMMNQSLLETTGIGIHSSVNESSPQIETDSSVSDIQEFKANRNITIPPTPSDHYPDTNGGEDADPVDGERRTKVKEMMKHAWDNFVLYAWGKNELRPISKRGNTASIFGSMSLGATIIDGLDTLYIMGMEEEFKQGRDWIAQNLSISLMSDDLSVYETNIRFVGGLLACFALTGDVMFLDKAASIAERLLPAFETKTGVPKALININTGFIKNYGWVSGDCSILSEFGTLHLELSYLSDVTGDPVYRNKVEHIRRVMQNMEKPQGLYPNYYNPTTGKWGQLHTSIGALGDGFYEYLLKSWIQSGSTNEEARQMYDDAMQHILEHMLTTSPGGLVYFSEMKFGKLENKMDHLACFSGGLLGLGAHTLKNNMSARYMEVADAITNTCHESYERSVVKLGPETFRFNGAVEAKALKNSEKYYNLRPDVVESYFIMWRLTKNQKYRDWGWEAVQALEKHCRVAGGFSGLSSVYIEDSVKDDIQRTFFLAATLKYLYLLFSDDSLISLDEWVFNTEAHPLPIKGVNPFYREGTWLSSNKTSSLSGT